MNNTNLTNETNNNNIFWNLNNFNVIFLLLICIYNIFIMCCGKNIYYNIINKINQNNDKFNIINKVLWNYINTNITLNKKNEIVKRRSSADKINNNDLIARELLNIDI